MSAARELLAMGLAVGLDPKGDLNLKGLHGLTKDKRKSALALAKSWKMEIVRELRFSSPPCGKSGISGKSPHGLESIPDRPPPDADFWAWHGAIDLRSVARQYGVTVWRSVRGSNVVVYPDPLDWQLVEYCAACLQDCRGYLASLPDIPTIPPAEALTQFRLMGGNIEEVTGGFVPVYPEEWPGYVKDAAQTLFLAAIDAIKGEMK